MPPTGVARNRRPKPIVIVYVVPTRQDVKCGRGTAIRTPAWKEFRKIIGRYSLTYRSSKSRLDKSAVVAAVLDKLDNIPSRLLRRDVSGWFEVSHTEAEQKIRAALREYNNYASNFPFVS